MICQKIEDIRIRVSIQPKEINVHWGRGFSVAIIIEQITETIKLQTRSIGIFIRIEENVRSVIFIVTIL